MKSKRILATSIFSILAVGLLDGFYASADNGTWTNISTAGTWSTTTGWNGGTVADGSGSTATFSSNITGTTTITLDSDRTIGNITFSDNGASGSTWIFASDATPRTLTLAGGTTSTISTTTSAEIGTVASPIVLAGTNSLTKAGAGTLTLTGTNTYSGGTVINAGELSARVGTAAGTYTTLGAGAVTANAGTTLRFLAGSTSNAITYENAINLNGATLAFQDGNHVLTGNVALAGANTIVGVYAGKNLTMSGVIGGAGSINKTNSGTDSTTLILEGANTYTGGTTITGGTINLNFAGAAAPTDNILALTGAVTLAGGTLNITGKASVTNAQTISALTVSPAISSTLAITGGASGGANFDTSANGVTLGAGSRLAMTLTAGTSGTVNASLGNVTRGVGASLNLTLPASGSVTSSLTNDASGIIGTWFSVGGTDLASMAAGSVVAYTGYTNVATGATIADGSLTNVALTGTAASTVLLGSGTTTVNTITQQNTAATSITPGLQTLRLGTAGGIFAGTGRGALTIGIGPNSGKLTAGSADNTAGTILVNNAVTTTLNLAVVDNGTGAVIVEKVGTGTLVLSGNNSYSGGTIIGNGATLQVGGGGTNGSLGSGAVTNGGTLTFNRLDRLVVANAISGIGAVSQTGLGTTIFIGTNTYSGVTTITAGTLQVGNGGTSGTLGTGAISVGAAGVLSFNRSDTVTLSTNLTGSTGTLRMDGTGVLNIVAGATVLPTNVIVNSGTVNVSGGSFGGNRLQGSGQIIINTGATMVLMTGNAHSLGGDNTGMGEAVTISGGTLTINQEQYLQTLTLNGGTINGTNEMRATSATTNYQVIGNTASTITARINNFGNANWFITDATNSAAADLTLSGQVTTTGALVKTGMGTLALSGNNTYTGATTFSGGSLILDYSTQNNTKLADAAALTLNGASVILSGGSHGEQVGSTVIGTGASSVVQTGGSAKLLMGAITRSGGGTLDVSAGSIATTTNAVDATGILGGWVTVGGGADLATKDGSGNIVAYTAYTDVAFAGAIADDGTKNVRLSGAGSGNITLSSAVVTVNTVTQNQTTATVIDTTSGTLRLGAVGSINVGTGKGALTIGTAANAGTLTAGGADNIAGELILNANGDTIIVNATVTNNGGGAVTMTKSGNGVVTLNGTNTFTGGVNVNAGTLALGSAGAIGTTGAIFLGGGSLQFSAANTTDYSARFSTAASQQYRLDTNGQAVTLATALTSTGGNLIKTGSGALTLTGASTYAGGTSVVNGTLILSGGDNRLATAGFVTLGNGTTGGVLALGGMAQTVAGLNVLGTGTANAVVGGSATASTLTFSNATINSTYAGNLGGAGTNENNLALTKSGTATLTLSGSSTYTGATVVSAGTLALAATGSITGTAGIQIASGATFTSAGTITLATAGVTGDAGTSSSIAVRGGGTFNLTGGTTTLAAFSANGIVNISGGNMTVSGVFYMGEQTTNPGYVNQTGGTVTLTSITSDSIRIGHWNNANGVAYYLTGGTLDASGTNVSTVNIGWDGRGEMTVGGGVGTATFKARAIRLDQGSGNSYSDTLTVSNNGVVEIGAGGISSSTANDYVILNGGTMRGVATSTWSSNMLANTGVTSTFDVGAGFTSTASGVISGTGPLNKTGAGTLTFSGGTANPYSGLITVSAGTLSLAKNNAIAAVAGNIVVNGTGTLATAANASGMIGDTSNVTINGPTALYAFGSNATDVIGTLAVNNGGTVTIGGSGSNLRPNGGITSTGGGSITGAATQAGINFNGATRNVTVTDSTLNIGVGIANGGLTKAGAGTLVLAGQSSYTGATTVNEGTLLVSGSIFGTAVSVNGGVLGGTGVVGGSIDVGSGASIQGGDGVSTAGSLAVDGLLTLGDNSRIRLTLGADGAHSSLVSLSASWVFDTDQAFTFIGAQAGEYTGILSGFLDAPDVSAWKITNADFLATFTYDADIGGVNVTLIAVPEPASLVYLCGGLGMLGLCRRRSRRAGAR